VTSRLTATLLGNKPFLDEIRGIFGGLLRSEKNYFNGKKPYRPLVLLLYLTTEHMDSTEGDHYI